MLKTNKMLCLSILNIGLILVLILSISSVGVMATQGEIRLAHVQPTGDITHLVAIKFKELVEKLTDKEITVQIFPNGMLGGDRDILEALSTGALEMTVAGTNILSWYTPEYSIMDGMFIFRDKKHSRAVWDSPIGDEIKKAIEKKTNIMTLATFYRSPRLLTSNKPVITPEDLKGLKIRLPEIKIWMDVWRQLGALPTPIAFPELFASLQTGIVDAQENPVELIYSAQFYEVQKYVSLTNHVYGSNVIHISKLFFDKLSNEQQQAIIKATKEAGEYGDGLQESSEGELMKKLVEKGMIIVEPKMELFLKLAQPAIEILKEGWRKGIYEEIQKY